jgi:hypothetical protein
MARHTLYEDVGAVIFYLRIKEAGSCTAIQDINQRC